MERKLQYNEETNTMLEIVDGEVVKEHTEIPKKLKQEYFIGLAKSGAQKPRGNNNLIHSFRNYIYPSCIGYDEDFTNKLKQIAPGWFTTSAQRNKTALLVRAATGGNAPAFKTSQYNRLKAYTNVGSNCYDKEFDDKIKKLAPHWFEKTVTINKNLLLEMAIRGKPRPSATKDRLGRLLCTYIYGEQKDREFTKRIKEAAPEWFRQEKVEA